MELRKLGDTKTHLSPLGLGCWQFSKNNGFAGKFWPSLTDEDTLNIVRTCLDGGINWFDTAELYGWGKSEEGLAMALEKLKVEKNTAIVATKWWPAWRRASSIKQTIDERLGRLGGYPITLHQVHMPFGFSSVEKEMNAMADLVDQGKIKHIGVSNFNRDKMIRANEALQKRGMKLASNQMEYSILNRKIETNGVMEAAKEHSISIIAYSPLAQGLVSGKFHDDPALIKSRSGWRKYKKGFSRKGLVASEPVVDALRKIAKKHNSSPSQVALNWLINYNGDTVFAIPGATKLKHAADNLGAMKIALSQEDIGMLVRVSRKFK